MNYLKSLLTNFSTAEDIKKYIKARFKEISTADGAVLVSVGVAYLMFSSIADYLAYAAIAYGVYRIFKSDE